MIERFDPATLIDRYEKTYIQSKLLDFMLIVIWIISSNQYWKQISQLRNLIFHFN